MKPIVKLNPLFFKSRVLSLLYPGDQAEYLVPGVNHLGIRNDGEIKSWQRAVNVTFRYSKYEVGGSLEKI